MTSSTHTNPLLGGGTPDTKRQQAFIDAVIANDETVRGFLIFLTHHDDVAKDLAQKTWLAVYESFKTEDFTKEALLKRKAWQTFMSHCRASKTRSFVEYTDNIDEIAPPCSRRKEGEEEEAALEARFWEQFLPLEFDPLDQKLFMLKARLGYTMDQIAARVGLPASTVFDKIEKLKLAAQEQLEKDI